MLSIDLHKTYHGKRSTVEVACKGSFVRGEVTALFGKSGAGKTSVLRMIAGLEKPDIGTIRFEGKMWFDKNSFVPTSERSVGIVFQDFNLFKNMTVLQNLNYAASGKLPSDINKLCEDLGVKELFERFPHELSKGQQQKVSILRTMCIQTDVLLLDEPFSALDDESILEIIQVINKLIAELVPIVILVTHRRDIILKMAESVIMMEEGTQGKPVNLISLIF